MKENGWICRTRSKKVPNLGKSYYVTKNNLGRDFQADKPLEKLVADITYLYFGKCKLYLSSIMNLYDREIVAYTISDCQDTDFVLDTLNQLDFPQGVILNRDQVNRLHFQGYTIRLVQKKASPDPCPVREPQRIMPVSNGSIPY